MSNKKTPIIDIDGGGEEGKITRPDWKERVKELITLSFQPDFLNGLIDLETLFNSITARKTMDVLEYNTVTGKIVYFIPLINEFNNKQLLDTIILDYENYSEFVNLQYYSMADENQADLIGVVDYAKEYLDTDLRYSEDDAVFYYEV